MDQSGAAELVAAGAHYGALSALDGPSKILVLVLGIVVAVAGGLWKRGARGAGALLAVSAIGAATAWVLLR